VNLIGSNITPDPNLKLIPLWLRACFWVIGAAIVFGWMARSEGKSISAFSVFVEMVVVVFVAILIALPSIPLSLTAILLSLARRSKSARRRFTEALRWNPTDESSYLNRGFVAFRLGDYEACIADLSRALEVKPRHFLGLFHRGTSYYMLEDHHHAMLDLSEASHIKPKNIITRVNLANTYLDSERYDEARTQYEAVLQQKPDHVVALANIGASYADEADFARAIEYYDRALAAYESPFFYCNRGLAYFMLGDEAQAEADIARGFEKRPRENVLGGDELRYLVRGQYRLLKGDTDGALDDLQKANELLPSRKDTMAGLAAAHAISGHADAARNLWNLLLERDPRFADSDFVRRRMYWPDRIMNHIKSLMSKSA